MTTVSFVIGWTLLWLFAIRWEFARQRRLNNAALDRTNPLRRRRFSVIEHTPNSILTPFRLSLGFSTEGDAAAAQKFINIVPRETNDAR